VKRFFTFSRHIKRNGPFPDYILSVHIKICFIHASLSADSRGTFFEAIRSEKQDMIRYPVIRGKMHCRIMPKTEFAAFVKRFFALFL